MWSPLAGTWRDRSVDDYGSPVRRNADEANCFQSGCIPNFSRMNMRKSSALEHELTWNYYKIRRHELHPERKQVGDPAMPVECVVEKMRFGKKNQFNFWRDLKPPFHVSKVARDSSQPLHHPDGEMFHVSYMCGIDYVGERLWNEKSETGTFDNMIHGTATVRVPDNYPTNGAKVTMVSWGRPTLNHSPSEETDGDGNVIPEFVNPDLWMPISQELDRRASEPRFADCRASTRRANLRRPVEMAPMQSLLLGAHGSLPRLAAIAAGADRLAFPSLAGEQMMTPSPKDSQRKVAPGRTDWIQLASPKASGPGCRNMAEVFAANKVVSNEQRIARQADRSAKMSSPTAGLKGQRSPTTAGSSPAKADSSMEMSPGQVDGGVEGAFSLSPTKKRRHRIFTAAAGFVSYAG